MKSRPEHHQREHFSAPVGGCSSLLSAPCSAGDGLHQPAPKAAQAVNHPIHALECMAAAGSVPLRARHCQQHWGCYLCLSGAGSTVVGTSLLGDIFMTAAAQADHWRDPSSVIVLLWAQLSALLRIHWLYYCLIFWPKYRPTVFPLEWWRILLWAAFSKTFSKRVRAIREASTGSSG